MAEEHHRVHGAVGLEHPEHRLGHRRIAHPDHLPVRPGGVGKRAEQVEDRRCAERPAHRGGVAHRRMEARGEAEAEPHLLDAVGDSGRAEVDGNAERLQHVGRARPRGGSSAAVLADPAARPGYYAGGHGRDVDRPRPVAAGAARVDEIAADLDQLRVLEHRRDEAGQLLHRLALRAQRCGEGGDLNRQRSSAEDVLERQRGERRAEVLAPEEPDEDAGPAAGVLEGVHRSRSGRPALRPTCGAGGRSGGAPVRCSRPTRPLARDARGRARGTLGGPGTPRRWRGLPRPPRRRQGRRPRGRGPGRPLAVARWCSSTSLSRLPLHAVPAGAGVAPRASAALGRARCRA